MSARGGLTVWRWELRRLAGQRRIQIVLALCLVGPWLFEAALAIQGQEPKDTLFGLWVHSSGWALPLVVLGFAAQWAFPLIVAAVSSGVFAGEDESGVWPVLLTHGRSRADVFAGKVSAGLTATALSVVVLGASAIVSGVVCVGDQPIVGLSGNLLSGGHLALTVIGSWASVLPPVLGFAMLALLLSVLTRHVIAAVLLPILVGLALELDSLIVGGDPLRHLLISTPWEAWHGMFADPVFLHPLWRGLAVSAGWFAGSLLVAALAFARRQFAGS